MNLEKIYSSSAPFRERIDTLEVKNIHTKIYCKKPSGTYYKARGFIGFTLLIILFGAPFIKINDQPLILLNVVNWKIILFGTTFWPQDFHLLALAVLTFVVFVILFTVVFGRIWCGWACPQTIFMEMIFRKIEYLIEGDWDKQRTLNKGSWTKKKIFKKVSKHTIFFTLSFVIGNTFLAYIIGIEELGKIISDPPSRHLSGLSALIMFSAIFYGVFSWFRERACLLVCPYGRSSSTMLDQNSLAVYYDFKRGEPKSKYIENQSRSDSGDCIACDFCLQVCPTGMDIKNGLQTKCINCTACLDACNQVMDRIGKSRGLIRLTSYQHIVNPNKFKFLPRFTGYSIILLMLLGLFTFLLVSQIPVETTIIPTPGVLYQETTDGKIQNLFNAKIINKSYLTRKISFRLKEPQGEIAMIGGAYLVVPKDALAESTFFVKIAKQNLKSNKTILYIEVLSGDRVLEVIKTTFVGPVF